MAKSTLLLGLLVSRTFLRLVDKMGICTSWIFEPVRPLLSAQFMSGKPSCIDVLGGSRADFLNGSEVDVLYCDWNKYEPIVATAEKDGTVGIWDLRQGLKPLGQLKGHRLAVRKVA